MIMPSVKLIQFQCQKEGSLFYYQTSFNNPHWVAHCPICGSKRVEPTGREYSAVDETKEFVQQ